MSKQETEKKQEVHWSTRAQRPSLTNLIAQWSFPHYLLSLIILHIKCHFQAFLSKSTISSIPIWIHCFNLFVWFSHYQVIFPIHFVHYEILYLKQLDLSYLNNTMECLYRDKLHYWYLFFRCKFYCWVHSLMLTSPLSTSKQNITAKISMTQNNNPSTFPPYKFHH